MVRTIICCLLLLVTCICTAQDRSTELLLNLNNAKSDSAKIEAYFAVSQYFRYSNRDSAYFYLTNGLEHFTKKNSKIGVACMNRYLAKLNEDDNDFYSAIERNNKSIKLFREAGKENEITTPLNQLGTIEAKKGNFKEATKFFLESMQLAQKYQDTSSMVAALTNFGRVSSYARDTAITLSYYRQALDLAGRVAPTKAYIRSISNICINLGIEYGKVGNFELAKKYFEQSAEKADTGEYIDITIYALMNMGILYERMGQTATAISKYDTALQIAQRKKLVPEQARLLVNKAHVLGEKNPAEAIPLLNEALKLVKNTGEKILLEELYTNLVEYTLQVGNYKEATMLMTRHTLLKDSLFNADKARAVANLQSIYELEQSQHHVRELGFAVQQQKQKRNALVVIACTLIVALIIVIYYYRKTNNLYMVVSRQKDELQQSHVVKDKLFSIIGHDLRGPVSSISVALEMMAAETDPKQATEINDMLQVQTRQTMETLENLLTWGRSLIVGQQQKNENFNARMPVDESIRLLGFVAAQKQLNITTHIPQGIICHGNLSQATFIVRNLLSNAIKYTHPGGSIVVAAKVSGTYITYTVTDNGIGIRAEKLSTLFDNIGDSTWGTEGEKGTGIGLPLCREFARAQGGDVTAANNADGGATFTYTIPAA
jgi:signal transduction histidine kinase